MLLSIAMIVKNEEKNIEKCLKALKKLEKSIDYELIIVDTGSKDNTVNIAKKYTKKIYKHEWNNNFAEMRNLSIRYCTGDWILVIDADEILENPDDLVGFFKEKYKLYNSGVVKFKNYTSKDMYIIGGLIRLFKNDKDFKYVGRVHEQPIYKTPVYTTNVTFNHYGYCRNDYDLMKYKYDRNISLLLKDLEEGKDEVYTLFQLCQTYSMANKKNEALKSIDKAYKLIQNKKQLQNNIKYLYVYRQLAIELFHIENYERTIDVCEKAIELSDKFIDFYYMLAKSNKFLNRYHEAEKHFDEYFKIYQNNKSNCIDYTTVVDFSTSRYDDMVIDRIVNLYQLKNYKKIIELCRDLNEKEKDKLNQIILYSILKEKEYKQISYFYKNKEIKEKDIETIVSVIQKIAVDGLNNNFKDAVSSFKDLNKTLDWYLKYIVFDEKANEKQINVSYNDFYSWKAEMLKLKIKEDISVLEEIKNLNNIEKEKYLSYIVNDYDCIKILNDYGKNRFLSLDIKELTFINIIESKLIFLPSIQGEKLENLIYRAFINNTRLINQIYNFKIINEENVEFILNRYEYFWYKVKSIINKYSSDKLSYIKNLKNLVKEMPEFKKILEAFTEKINENIVSNQMKNEKENVLINVEQLVKNNMLDEAESVLRELDSIFIYDVEIKNSLGVVLFLKGELDNSLINLALSNTLRESDFGNIYNLACVLEARENFCEAKYYYSKAYEICNDEEFKLEINNIINTLDIKEKVKN